MDFLQRGFVGRDERLSHGEAGQPLSFGALSPPFEKLPRVGAGTLAKVVDEFPKDLGARFVETREDVQILGGESRSDFWVVYEYQDRLSHQAAATGHSRWAARRRALRVTSASLRSL